MFFLSFVACVGHFLAPRKNPSPSPPVIKPAGVRRSGGESQKERKEDFFFSLTPFSMTATKGRYSLLNFLLYLGENKSSFLSSSPLKGCCLITSVGKKSFFGEYVYVWIIYGALVSFLFEKDAFVGVRNFRKFFRQFLFPRTYV